MPETLGIVVIGRNEGERLQRCLQSIMAATSAIVYVDSGSVDGSVEWVRSLGVAVVPLDLSIPFTAARARNAGVDFLLAAHAALEFVQFVDGDCEVVEGWLAIAQQTLRENPSVAVVCGRRRERFPQHSVYNHLCDLEWNTPVGEAIACGGDAMMRVRAFQQVGGFDPTLIAGEEPELCVRLRRQHWRIWRLAAEMTRHDAQITRFSQWWRRSLRAGHAYAEGAWRHGRSPEQHWVRESQRIWLWGCVFPVLVLASAGLTAGASLTLLAMYPLLAYRIYRRLHRQGWATEDARIYAFFCILGKFPEAQGQFRFHWNRLRGRRNQLVEYKTDAGSRGMSELA